jgi:hypothetical protein
VKHPLQCLLQITLRPLALNNIKGCHEGSRSLLPLLR